MTRSAPAGSAPAPPPSLHALAEAARATGQFAALGAAVPYAAFLGVTCEVQDGELRTRMAFGDHLVGNPVLPALHGGTLGAVLESAAIFELVYRGKTVVLPRTISITIDYLRSAAAVDTVAVATVVRYGRRVATVTATAWQGDRAAPVASLTGKFIVAGPASEPP